MFENYKIYLFLLFLCYVEPQQSPKDCIARLQEDLPTEVLFYYDINCGSPALYRVLRDYLVLEDFRYKKQPDINRIMNGLSHCFFFDEADKALDLRSLKTTPLSKPKNIENRTPQDYESKRIIAHRIAQRFKKEEGYSGDLKEDILDFFEKYESAARDYMLDSVQQLRNLQNLFGLKQP